MDRFVRILDKDQSKIDSVVLGQFDGKSRSIDYRVLKQLHTRNSIKSLLLHSKISFTLEIVINE